MNSVAPGPTDTPLLAPDSPWRDPDYLATLPLGRLVTPDEVAETVLFLIEEGTYFAGPDALAERRSGDLMQRLDGRVALVSGAAQGLGRAIATRLAAEGARVAVNDRRPSAELDELAAETGGVAAVADVSDPEAVARMVGEVEQALGPIEVLVANHAYMTMKPVRRARPRRLVAQRRREPLRARSSSCGRCCRG